jgi:hypothetical protein
MAIDVSERDGQVYWYPSRDISPLSFDDDGDVPHDPPSTPP